MRSLEATSGSTAVFRLLFPHFLIPIRMKKTLLALTLLAFTGATAFAHDGGNKGKKKEACSAEAKAKSHCGGEAASLGGTPSCCMKKGAKAAATTAPAATPAAKAL
jgi:hypothetical protein